MIRLLRALFRLGVYLALGLIPVVGLIRLMPDVPDGDVWFLFSAPVVGMVWVAFAAGVGYLHARWQDWRDGRRQTRVTMGL